jgi:Organic solvent tolerance protein OstA
VRISSPAYFAFARF